MKFYMVVKYYLESLNFKFHEDPSFRWGDICKTKRRLFDP